MDPLDHRLTAAGTAWRDSQPEPPDLDRLITGLEPRRTRGFSPRLAFVLMTGLLLLGAVAVGPGVGGILQGPRNGLPVTATSTPAPTPTSTPAPTPTPTSTPPTPTATVPPSDQTTATDLLDRYETALVAGRWQTAFEMLSPASPTRGTGLAAYAAERAQYYQSVAGRYAMGVATRQVPDWSTYAPLVDGADLTRAYLIEVDYPALSNNNAGYEQFVVAPDASGTWWIWPVR